MAPIIRLQTAVFFVMLAFASVYSTLAVYAGALGASSLATGLVLAVTGGARLLVNVPAGILSERFGRRNVLSGGLLLLAAGSILAVWADGLRQLSVCLILQAVGSAAYTTAALSLIADISTSENRLRDLAGYQGAFVIGASFGPLLGGEAVAAFGNVAPFALQAAFSLLALGVTWHPWPAVLQRVPQPPAAGSVRGAITGPAVAVFGLMFVRTSTSWLLLPFMAQQNLGMSVDAIGIMLTAGALANVAVLPFAPRFALLVGRSAIVNISGALIVLGVLLLAVPGSFGLFSSSVLCGVAVGLGLPTLTAIAADRTPKGQTGAVMGIIRSMSDVALLTGPPLVGAAVDHLAFGQLGGVALCAVVAVACVLIYGLMSRARASAVLFGAVTLSLSRFGT